MNFTYYYANREAYMQHKIDLSDVTVFESVYKQYHVELYRYAKKYVRDGTIAEEMVQELFLYIWEKAEQIQITTGIRAYLYTGVKNRCLNYLKSRYALVPNDTLLPEETEELNASHNFTENAVSVQELQDVMNAGISQLPEKCRLVFHLSRETGLSYQEIAQELQISIKTVEAQMGTALKRLRTFVNRHGYSLLWLLLAWSLL